MNFIISTSKTCIVKSYFSTLKKEEYNELGFVGADFL
jgi:hypothetical protein